MKFHPSNPIQITLFCLVLILSYSCNKDSDLLAEYVIENPEIALSETVVTLRNSSVIIKPSGKYANGNSKKSTITDVSTPSIGTAVINEDNSITYTPDTDITGTDEFNYTTDVTNTDNTITQETGSITVTITDENPISTEPGDMGELKAFPGAEGFGKNATGGRGGKVLFVTNLYDSGPGSFRAAVEASGARTVIFRVGGTITLTSGLTVENGNLTIAGETAPGDGILLKGDIFQVKAPNVIVRFLRSRYGGSGEGTGDAMSVYASSQNVYDVIFDHCSISWGGDENFNVRGNGSYMATDITVQNSIIAECGYGVLLYDNSDRVSFYGNLLAFNKYRNIRANFASNSTSFRYEMVNNLVFGFVGGNVASGGIKYSLYKNKYKKSSSVSVYNNQVVDQAAADGGADVSWTYAYIAGNDLGGMSQNSSNVTPYLESTPYTSESGLIAAAMETSKLDDALLSHIGAGLSRDAVDKRIINSYMTGTESFSSLGTYPTITGGSPYLDSDEDGMEDDWEIANNLNPKDSSDGQKDRNGDGYTNLEEFLHSLTQK